MFRLTALALAFLVSGSEVSAEGEVGHPSLVRVEPGVAPEADHPVDVVVTLDGSAALVLHRTTGNLSVYDMVERRLDGVLDVGQRPRDIELTPDGARALILDEATAELIVVDLAARAISGTLAVGTEPVIVRSSVAGDAAFVTDASEQRLFRVDLATLAVTASAPVVVTPSITYGTSGGHFRTYLGFEPSADGTRLFYPNYDSGLEVRDAVTLEVLHSIALSKVRSVVESPEPGLAQVVYSSPGVKQRFGTIDWVEGELLSSQKIPDSDLGDGRFLERTADGGFVIDLNDRPARLVLGPNTVTKANERFNAMELTSDGERVVAVEDELHLYDAATLELLHALPLGEPYERAALLALAPSGKEGVAIVRHGREQLYHFGIDGGSSELLASLPTGPIVEADGPSGLALSADGRTAWVTHSMSRNVSEIDLATGGAVRHFDLAPDGDTVFPGNIQLMDGESRLLVLGSQAGGSFLWLVELPTGEVVTEVDFGDDHPAGLALSGDGGSAVVTLPNYDPFVQFDNLAVLAFDGTGVQITDRIPIDSVDPLDPSPALSEDGRVALVVSQQGAHVQVVDVERGRVAAEFQVPGSPDAVRLRAAGDAAAVAHANGVTFLHVDGDDSRVLSTDFVGDVSDLAYDATETRLFASVRGARGALVVYDAQTLERLQFTELDLALGRIALNEEGTRLFAVEQGYSPERMAWFDVEGGQVGVMHVVDVGERIDNWKASARRDRMVTTMFEVDALDVLHRPYAESFGRASGADELLTLSAQGEDPSPGATFSLAVGGAPAGATGTLLVSLAPNQADGSGLLLATPILLRVPFEADEQGRFTLPITVPDEEAWNGTTVYLQAVVRHGEDAWSWSAGLELGIWE